MSEPQPQDQDNQPRPESQAERQRQVEALADAYLERLLAGEAPNRQEFLAAHPELADLLGPRLELVELMHRVARGQRPAAGKTASLAPDGAAGERVFRVKCPHCGNGIQLIDTKAVEVTCSGCGSSFHVEPGATTSFNPSVLPRSIGRFEVLEQLGRGAFGIVYKARDPQLQRLVAVKVPRAGSFATAEEEERFLREARAAAQLNHPGIVSVLEIAHDRGVPYIVSGYVEGLTLADVLTARRPGFRETAELVAAVADALDFAHRSRIVHRDIKPSNLLLDDAGRPHITDFGLARRGEPEITVTLDGQILGTPAYMSPEQAAGDQQHVDARSDVYSLGVVLYELLTGELPFRGNQRMLLHQVIHDEPRPPRSLNDRVPRDLETICLKAMAKAPGRRYAGAREMADDLHRFLSGEPIRARRVGRAEKLARWARRNPVVAALTAAVALLLIAVAAGEFMYVVNERRLNSELSDALDTAEKNHREAELRAASAAVDLDLKHCEDREIEYGVLRLARTLAELPPHLTELRQCVEMNLLAWAQEKLPLGPRFQYDGSEAVWELSPDGLTVLTGGADWTARLWDAFTGEVRATLRGHRGGIGSIAFSQNGRVAMTDGADRTVRLWDASNGLARGVTAVHQEYIDKALLSPDGQRLLTIYHETQGTNAYAKAVAVLSLWDTATGKRMCVLVGHDGRVHDAAFNPDGQMVLTGGADKTARLWSAESGRPLGILEGHTGQVFCVAFSPDRSTAASLDDSGLVRWWDLQALRQIEPPCKVPKWNLDKISDSRQFGLHFIHREVVVMDVDRGVDLWFGICFIRGLENGIEFPNTALTSCKADDHCVVDPQGKVYDLKSLKRRYAPAGRKFIEELARFATEGRFLVLDGLMVDLRAEKRIGKNSDARYVHDRHIFVVPNWPSPRYVPLPGAPLDAEEARLFAEVVTCHELDPAGATQLLKESEWEERRRMLVARLDVHPGPFLMSRLAADRWFWLRRQIERATTAEEKIKYLDRLISVEPTWQNYDRRATEHNTLRHHREVALDAVEAGKRAGAGYWYGHRDMGYRLQNWRGPLEMIDRPAGAQEDYQAGLRLTEALIRVFSENLDYRVHHAIALYRLGRYADALSHLEYVQKERELDIVSQLGRFFMMGWQAVALPDERFSGRADIMKGLAFLAMTHHRLGHPDRARAALADLRRWSDVVWASGSLRWSSSPDYQRLLHEAEALIEGKPPPGK